MVSYNLFPKTLKESEIQKQIMEVLKFSGWLVVRINSGATKIGNRFIRNYIIANNGKSSGLSDVVAFKNNKVLLIEVKKHGGRLSTGQKEFIELAKSYGVDVHVINNIEDLEELIRNI